MKKYILFLYLVRLSQMTLGQSDALAMHEINEKVIQYFKAKELNQKNKVAQKIIKLKPDFDSIYHLLKLGKNYDTTVKKGFIEMRFPGSDNRTHYVLIYIPVNYDPQKKYPVKVWLHGGVSGYEETARLNQTISKNIQEYKNYSSIMVYPAGWYLAPWLSEIQTENISNIISYLKNNYNIDENRISLSGCSDGGTGTFHFSNTIPTFFSNFTSTIGCLGCLRDIEKEFYCYNLTNKPFFVINTGKDKIFDIRTVTPFMDLLKKNGVRINYLMLDTAGHTCNLGPIVSNQVQSFVKNNPRNPFPDSIHWETDNDSIYNRYHWYVMNKIGKTKTDYRFTETNKIYFNNDSVIAFKREKNSGRAEIIKSGNIVTIKTSGIKEYTLLLSPEHFDFHQPIIIYTNGIISFQGKVEKNLNTLFKWNIIDDDRTMLFGAEVKILIN